MKTEIIYWLLLGIILVIPALLWIRTFFTRSFSPLQGEIYLIVLLGLHLFEVRIKSPTVKWFQKLIFYPLFWPFNRGTFMYEWTSQMTYEEYLKRKKVVENKKDHNISIVWQPRYKESELGLDGLPKDKTTLIIVSRKEMMFSLKPNESFTLAVEFETEDGWRGWRLFTLFLEIKSLSKIISEFRQWQQASALTFKGEYNSWSKTVSYETLRSTTMNQLNVKLGKNKDVPFVDEINEQTEEFGYRVKSIKEGDIYLSDGSIDLLEAQEKKRKAEYDYQAAKVEAETTEVNANADAKAIGIIAKAEAEKITTIGTAKNQVLGDRIKKLKDLYSYQKDLIVAKYGNEGLKNLKFYIEGNGSENSNVQKMVDDLLALNIHDELKQEGGS